MKCISKAVLILCLSASIAFAAEAKFVGTISKITVDKAQATVVIKDSGGKEVTVIVKDELTLEKFKDKRIVEGDEIRLKYDTDTGVTTVFRKTAGC